MSELQNAKQRIIDFSNGHSLGIILAGHPGCGKTHLAHVVAKHWGSVALMVSEPDMLAAIQATYKDKSDGDEGQIIRRYRSVPMLIIDDVGAGHVRSDSRSWLDSIYWRILDNRSKENHPIMITTNLTLERLGEWIGQRATSRLMGMLGSRDYYVDLFSVPDYRTRGW